MTSSSSSWISLCGVLAAVCAVQAAFTHYETAHCECNGRSPYCLRDALGLHCVDCQGNTMGRHCERCKAGFYQEEAGLSCTPCRCNPTGSVSSTCDSRGRCSCKQGVTGDKCDRCPDGPIGLNGCSQRRQLREDPASLTLPCFCYGHSSRCSAQSGYSVHSITSTFTDGTEGWTVATAQGVAPDAVYFRWSPTHQDLEVISKSSLPVYLYAPAPYLGNQLLSYGQNLSFSLRLDREIRHPSTNDVILEGAGLRVSTSMGDLRSPVPCGQKINYSFRLDEQPGSRWTPQLSSFQFQTLLQNLTAIKIRATFGENGRGYLDNVQLVSAQRGDGVPARWVHTCNCPRGYEGDFCERCTAGFRRRFPVDGAFSTCEPCSCQGGSCDWQTGDCYSADEERSCSEGFYRHPWQPQTCVKCPCPEGVTCSLAAGSLEPRCDRCPPGTTGLRCDICREGFYGDPAGATGVQRPCRPCQCNGHIDVSVAGSCDRSSGECLKCLNHTMGGSCEACLTGFYHSRSTEACTPCNCDVQGSESEQCDDFGHCRCRAGFEGLRCQRSNCPACFGPVKTKMGAYTVRLKELESQFSDMNGGLRPVSGADIEAALRATEKLVKTLQDDTEQLLEMEKSLQRRLSSISRRQLEDGQDIQNIGDTVDDIKQQHKTYETKAAEVQTLMEEMKRKLEEAKTSLRSAELPQGDAVLGPNLFSLLQTATSLADKHQTKADAVERTANEALSDSEKSLALVRNLMNKENKVKGLIGDLKTTYDQAADQVKSLENQAIRVSSEARDESKMANGMLKSIVDMERNIPLFLTGEMDAMVSRMDGINGVVDKTISGIDALQDSMQQDKATATDLLAKSKVAQQDFNKLLGRVNVAKADTEGTLQRINSNTKELDDALNTLRGFDQQIEGSRALADAAIKRLPGINGTIQQAVGNNFDTNSMLKTVNKDFNGAKATINLLENAVTELEGTFGSLPSYTGLVNEATTLNKEAMLMMTKATDTAGNLNLELGRANRLEADAEQAAAGATAAFSNAKLAKDAVGKTLQDINSFLANMNQTGVVDEKRLKQLEDSLAGAQREVEGRLTPRFRDMVDQEATMRRRLTVINRDIDTILRDIANLDDIMLAIPAGCYNNPPIEEA